MCARVWEMQTQIPDAEINWIECFCEKLKQKKTDVPPIPIHITVGGIGVLLIEIRIDARAYLVLDIAI